MRREALLPNVGTVCMRHPGVDMILHPKEKRSEQGGRNWWSGLCFVSFSLKKCNISSVW